MAKTKERDILSRLKHADLKLESAIKSGDKNKINAAKERIRNLEAMAGDDYDYGKFKKGGAAKFPDLNKDGKVTKADILKGRGVPGFKHGGAACSPRKEMAGAMTMPKRNGRKGRA